MDLVIGLVDTARELMAQLGGSASLAAATLEEARGLVDDVFQREVAEASTSDAPITCRGIGCFWCCRGEIAVIREEADRLVERATEDQLRRAWKDRDALTSTDNETRTTAWCPLLDRTTGRCEQYDERPLVCRSYHVVTPPEWCSRELSGVKEVGSYPIPMALSLAFHVARAFESNGATIEEPSLGARLVEEARRRGVCDAAEGGTDGR